MGSGRYEAKKKSPGDRPGPWDCYVVLLRGRRRFACMSW